MLSHEVTLTPPFPVALDSLVAPWGRGLSDPLARWGTRGKSSYWTSARLGSTGVLLRISRLGLGQDDGGQSSSPMAPFRVRMWAQRSPAVPGAIEQLEAQLPAWLGFYDDWSDFYTSSAWQLLPSVLQQVYHRHPGIRLGATSQLLTHGVAAITEQRVTGIEAMGGLRAVLRKIARPFPATGYPDQPQNMLFFPGAEELQGLPSWVWHRAGYDGARASTVLRFCHHFPSLERLLETGTAGELASALKSIPGIGPWTVAEILQRTHGHPDALSVGDYHLAKHVGWVFEGKRANDARMLELLSPFVGNRGRVVALMKAGRLEAPKHGPRYSPQDHRHH